MCIKRGIALLIVIAGLFLFLRESYARFYNRYEQLRRSNVLMSGEDQKSGVSATLVDWYRDGLPAAVLIENKSRFIIELNVAADKYHYITSDGNYFALPPPEKDEPYYPTGIVEMNPGEKVGILLNHDPERFYEFRKKYSEGQVVGMQVEINYGKIKLKLAPPKV
ncbi:MAG: hypothetical protein KKC84_04425 [Candidatus Omnitrophica bacterium]|nr:hypothetical protein [Candidatus Omnitrophota bacterium]